jgi:Glycosyl transferase family group 2
MQISNNYFENWITFFTNLTHSAIRFGVANGDVTPFVGHNAVLQWSAFQEVTFETNGVLKFYSENHVSEDFDMALRLQIKDYITRLAAETGSRKAFR